LASRGQFGLFDVCARRDGRWTIFQRIVVSYFRLTPP